MGRLVLHLVAHDAFTASERMRRRTKRAQVLKALSASKATRDGPAKYLENGDEVLVFTTRPIAVTKRKGRVWKPPRRQSNAAWRKAHRTRMFNAIVHAVERDDLARFLE